MFLLLRAICPALFVHPICKVSLSLVIAFAAWLPQLAQAQVVVLDNLSAAPAGNISVSTTQWMAIPFQVGPTNQRISEWTVGSSVGGASTNVTLSLFALDPATNLPSGGALASAVVPWVIGVNNTYTAASLGAIATTTLTANMKYGLAFGPAAAGNVRWTVTNTALTFSGGFAAAGTSFGSNNSGASWSVRSYNFVAQLKVAPVPVASAAVAVPTLEFWSLSALGILVAGLGAHRMRRKNTI